MTFDYIQVDVPVRTCFLGDSQAFVTTTTTQITGHTIGLVLDQDSPTGCVATGDGITTKAFTFFIQPLSQGSYTVNFTRTADKAVDLQRSATFMVNAPFGTTAPTLTHFTVLLLPLLLLVAEALVIAVPSVTQAAEPVGAEVPLEGRSWRRGR